jgi:hypothetical protein
MAISSTPLGTASNAGTSWRRRLGALAVFLAALFGGGLAGTASAAVTITSMTPNHGLTLGLGIVTLTGSDFVPLATTVTIGDTTVPAIVVTPNLLTFITPAHVTGNVAVRVNTPFGTSAPATGGFTYANLPTLLSSCLLTADVAGGTVVTLGGSNFISGGTAVTIGGILVPAAAVTVNSDTSLSFIAPPHAPGAVPISVTTIAGISLELGNCVTYAAAPTAASILPHGGLTLGATLVLVNGSGFTPGTNVTIGGNTVPAIVLTPSTLTFLTPPHAAGNVALTVSTPIGTSAPVPGGFTYIGLPTLLPNCLLGASVSGGALVTLNGTNFVAGETSVTIGGVVVPAAAVTVLSSTQLTFLAPPHAAGVVPISVETFAGISLELPACFTYADTPSIASITPPGGPTTGGNTVALTGTGFMPGLTTVLVDGQTIIPSAVLPTAITFVAPPHAAGTIDVVVVTLAGTSNPAPGGYQYDARPAVSALDPVAGPLNGTPGITLTGAGFNPGNTTVTFDGVTIVPTAITATSLTFDAPAHAAGTVDVSVTTPGGTSGNVPGGFTYLDVPVATALNPAFSDLDGHIGVELTGQGFTPGITIVNFDGQPITPTSVTATALIFDAPAHAAGTVAVSVTTAGGTSNNVLGGFTYAAAPTAASLAPVAGPLTGTPGIAVTGTGFMPGNTTVVFDGAPIVPTVLSSTQLTFDAPPHAAGTVSVAVETPVGTSAPIPGGFTYADAPTVGSIAPSIVPVTGLPGIILEGTGFVPGQTIVLLDGVPVTPVSVTPTALTFDAPPHAAGTVTVAVQTPLGTSANLAGGLTYAASPSVSALSPQYVPLTGAAGLVLTGANFVPGNTTVLVDGAPVIPSSVTPTSVTFDAPPHAAATVAVSVTTPGGNSGDVPGGLTYISGPSLVAATPPVSPLTGTPGVTLTGSGFIAGNTTVTLDGTPIVPSSVTPTSLVFDAPAHAAGTVALSVTTPVGTSPNLVGGFTYAAGSAIAGISPNHGPAAGGNTATISGINFTGTTSVTFDGAAASFTVDSATQITATVPAGTGSVDVAITAPGGNTVLAGGYTYLGAPTLGAASPSVGAPTGGTVVTITGTDFVPGETTITIGGTLIPAVDVVVNSPTSLTITTPPHAPGAVDISVTTPGGSATLTGAFTYLDSPVATSLTPQSGPTTGNTLVTVSGSNFLTGATSIAVDGVTLNAGDVTIVSPTALTFNTPAHAAGTVPVSVTTPAGTATVASGFTYLGGPSVTAVSPDRGPASGGSAVTLTGTNFEPFDTVVSIQGQGGNVGTVTVNSSTSLTFFAPAHAPGAVTFVVTTPGGTATAPSFTYVASPTATALTPNAGPVAGGTSVTITGSNFTAGDTSVTIGGTLIPAAAVTVNSATSLTFTTPAHTAGNVPVFVTTAGGLSSDIPGGFTYGNPALTVTAGDFTVTGDQGGAGGWATTSATTAYVLTNTGVSPLTFSVTLPAFLDATPLSGTLNAGASVTVTPTVNASAASLAPGTYTGTLNFTSTGGDFTRNAALIVRDITPPALVSGPANITVNAPAGATAATVTYATPAFSDNVAVTGVVRTAGLASGSAFPIGTTTVTHRASDAAGNNFDYSFTITVTETAPGTDTQPPLIANLPADIVLTITAPTTTAVANWTAPTVTDNVPGATIAQTAGPVSGSSFPIGTTTITYTATDAAGLTTTGSFTVTVNQVAEGTISLVVESGTDGTYNFTSDAPGLSTTIATSNGTASFGPVSVAPGTYTLLFTVPSGVGVTSAACTTGTLDTASQSGTITVTPGIDVTCTVRAEDSLGVTANALGSYLEHRAALIIENAPDISRRLNRLAGHTASGGVTGYGITMGQGDLPFSMNVGADEMSFSTSLLRSSTAGEDDGPTPPRNLARATSVADPLGNQLFGASGDRILLAPLAQMESAAANGPTRPGQSTLSANSSDDPMVHRFDVWAEGRFARFDAPGGDGTFGILHLGADYLVTPDILVGVGVQFDWLREHSPIGGEIEGQGFMAGPYMTARLSKQLYVDLRAAWGTADNDVSPFGTYTDAVKSDRMLVTGALVGEFQSGAMTIRPEARLTWYREETDDYVDSLGVAIPAFTVETGVFEFGPELSWLVKMDDGASFRPSLKFQGIWTFIQENTATELSTDAVRLAETGVRGRIELGLDYRRGTFSIGASTFYDGIGQTNFEALGGRFKLSLGL